AAEGLCQFASQRTASDNDEFRRELGQREDGFVGQVPPGPEPRDGWRQRGRPGSDYGLAESQLSAVNLHDVGRDKASVPEVDLCARLFNCIDCIALAAQGTHPTDPLHDRTEVASGRGIEPKAELGPTAGIMDR